VFSSADSMLAGYFRLISGHSPAYKVLGMLYVAAVQYFLEENSFFVQNVRPLFVL
jgi:hypothetical protein